jgi:hypothetical protein
LSHAVWACAHAGIWGSYRAHEAKLEEQEARDEEEEDEEDEKLHYSREMLDAVIAELQTYNLTEAYRYTIEQFITARRLCDLFLSFPLDLGDGEWGLSDGPEIAADLQCRIQRRREMRQVIEDWRFVPALREIVLSFLDLTPASDVRFVYYDDESTCDKIRKAEKVGELPHASHEQGLCAIA